MMWIIDRIESDESGSKFAVCEADNGTTFAVPLTALPEKVCEGDVLSVSADEAQTNGRKKSINKLMNDLFVD